MRISGGSAKGRNVRVRKVFAKTREAAELRPTSAKVRKAVFDILGSRVSGCRFLDLYAGSGAVGIEALSRGAAGAVFIEADSRRAQAIQEVLEKFSFAARADVFRKTASSFLSPFSMVPGRAGSDTTFDVLFVDPPYESEEIARILPLIATSRILDSGGRCIIEHPTKKALPAEVGNLYLMRTYRYGDSTLSLYAGRDERSSHATGHLPGDL